MKFGVFVLLIWLCAISVFGDDFIEEPVQADSILERVDTLRRARSDRFYDALLQRFNKSRISGLVVKSIISTGGKSQRAEIAEYRLVKERKYYEAFKGRTIREISIIRSDVFNDEDSVSYIRRVIRQWHKLSREQMLRRYLLFNKGTKIDAELMMRNEQLLRSLSFLSDAYIILQNVGDREVDVFVYTHDNLSLSPAFSSQGSQRFYVSLSESNLWGTGNKLEFGTFLSSKVPFYWGYKGDFRMCNLYGTFFDFDLQAYKDYTSSVNRASLEKNFILPVDYAGGLSYEFRRYNDFQRIPDSTVVIGENILDAWAGKSFRISPALGSYYLSARWTDTDFPIRYDVNPVYNPEFHNRRCLLLSTGIYKESFYQGNLIYGFGRSEDIAYGFRVECIGGYSWEEYARRSYMAGRLQFGKIVRFGFLNQKVEMGSYFNYNNRRYEQSVFSYETNYFTHLIPVGRWGIRNFLSVKYMRGFNRLVGEDEKLYFSMENSPRAIRMTDNNVNGYNRLITSFEPVAFSPIYLHNFRFAFYGFLDWAWLGYNRSIFKNDYYSTAGLGVRIKNERLIFQTIQLRIGFSLKRPAGTQVDWLDISEEQRMKTPRLIPMKPAVAEYR